MQDKKKDEQKEDEKKDFTSSVYDDLIKDVSNNVSIILNEYVDSDVLTSVDNLIYNPYSLEMFNSLYDKDLKEQAKNAKTFINLNPALTSKPYFIKPHEIKKPIHIKNFIACEEIVDFIDLNFYPFKNKNQTLKDLKNLNFFDLDNQDFFSFININNEDHYSVNWLFVSSVNTLLTNIKKIGSVFFKMLLFFDEYQKKDKHDKLTNKTIKAMLEGIFLFLKSNDLQNIPYMWNGDRPSSCDESQIKDALLKIDDGLNFLANTLNVSPTFVFSNFLWDKKSIGIIKNNLLDESNKYGYNDNFIVTNNNLLDSLFTNKNKTIHLKQDFLLKFLFNYYKKQLDNIKTQITNYKDVESFLKNYKTAFNLVLRYLILLTNLFFVLPLFFDYLLSLYASSKKIIKQHQDLALQTLSNFQKEGLKCLNNNDYKNFVTLINHFNVQRQEDTLDNSVFNLAENVHYRFINNQQLKNIISYFKTYETNDYLYYSDTLNNELKEQSIKNKVNNEDQYNEDKFFLSNLNNNLAKIFNKENNIYNKNNDGFLNEYANKQIVSVSEWLKYLELTSNFKDDKDFYLITNNILNMNIATYNNDNFSAMTINDSIFLKDVQVLVCNEENKELFIRTFLDWCDFYKTQINEFAYDDTLKDTKNLNDILNSNETFLNKQNQYLQKDEAKENKDIKIRR